MNNRTRTAAAAVTVLLLAVAAGLALGACQEMPAPAPAGRPTVPPEAGLDAARQRSQWLIVDRLTVNNAAELAGSLALPADSIDAAMLAAGAVGTDEIAAGAVTSASIGAGAVTSAALASGAVTTAKIADDAITAAKIADGAVGGAQVSDDAIGAAEIVSNAITADELADDAVTGDKIAAGAVTSASIGAQAITAVEIENGTIGNADLANDAVTSNKIDDDEVKPADIDDPLRSVPIPLLTFYDCTSDGGALLDFSSGADAFPDFVNAATDGQGLKITFDDTGGSIDTGRICAEIVTPRDYDPLEDYPSITVVTTADGVSGDTEYVMCNFAVDGAAPGTGGYFDIQDTAALDTPCYPTAGVSVSYGDVIVVSLWISSTGTVNDAVSVHAVRFDYYSIQ